jgi:hypothetical protein
MVVVWGRVVGWAGPTRSDAHLVRAVHNDLFGPVQIGAGGEIRLLLRSLGKKDLPTQIDAISRPRPPEIDQNLKSGSSVIDHITAKAA